MGGPEFPMRGLARAGGRRPGRPARAGGPRPGRLARAGRRGLRRLALPAAALCMLSFVVAAAGPASATSTAASAPAVTAPGGPAGS